MCEYDEKMVFPTIDDDGDGGRRMVGYEGYRFRGIGHRDYENFVHLDMGPEREW